MKIYQRHPEVIQILQICKRYLEADFNCMPVDKCDKCKVVDFETFIKNQIV